MIKIKLLDVKPIGNKIQSNQRNGRSITEIEQVNNNSHLTMMKQLMECSENWEVQVEGTQAERTPIYCLVPGRKCSQIQFLKSQCKFFLTK